MNLTAFECPLCRKSCWALWAVDCQGTPLTPKRCGHCVSQLKGQAMNLDNTHLMILRAMRKSGWEVSLHEIMLRRFGATTDQWAALMAARLVCQTHGRYAITAAGKTAYKKQSIGRYF